jgi:lipoprotein-anchoring transpeptidase ErfK/SrfK
MKYSVFCVSLFVLVSALSIHPARAAGVTARIDLSAQRMSVYVGGKRYGRWRVSTARRGYRTPIGRFRPQRLHRRYFSRRYYNSPMPHSVFFYKGYAIHGSYQIKRLGRPASHGCVRLHPRNAARLFGLIRRHGMRNTRIIVTR